MHVWILFCCETKNPFLLHVSTPKQHVNTFFLVSLAIVHFDFWHKIAFELIQPYSLLVVSQ